LFDEKAIVYKPLTKIYQKYESRKSANQNLNNNSFLTSKFANFGLTTSQFMIKKKTKRQKGYTKRKNKKYIFFTNSTLSVFPPISTQTKL